MRTLDETDLRILRLLLEDARRPYNDIADRVDVSAPTVSDRIDRLEELGVIEGFTVEVDHATFTDGIDVLIDIELRTTTDRSIAEAFSDVTGVEHVFVTADARLVAVATLRSDRIGRVLSDALDEDAIESYRVHLLEERSWTPTIGGPELSLSCAECDDEVTGDGVSLRFDGELYHFCDSSCRSTFEDRRVTFAGST